MCNFFSSILTIDGRKLRLRLSQSHEDIIDFYGLRDNGKSFVRGEFTSDTLWDIDTYKFKLDESIKPEWVTGYVIEDWTKWCKNIVKSLIITTDRKLLIDDTYIVKDCHVNRILSSIILSISGNAKVDWIYGNAKVDRIYDNAKVDWIYNNAKVDRIYGNAKVNWIYGNAKVDWISGNAKVDWISGNAKIEKDERIK